MQIGRRGKVFIETRREEEPAVNPPTVPIIEVNTPEPWYLTRLTGTGLGGLSPTRGYAPFPVFLEGWKSEPWHRDTTYTWDFGDGSPTEEGFNAAHVYETPGTYTITLTVASPGRTSTSTWASIEVLPVTTTYYVDAEAGDDSNSGTTEEAAWKTIPKIFKAWPPGTRILLKRGQTFPYAGSWASYGFAYGFSFGAYGLGDRPIIQRSDGGSAAPFMNWVKTGHCHISFSDIVFDGSSPSDTTRSSIYRGVGGSHQIMFLRCGFRNGVQHVGWNCPAEPNKERVTCSFVIDCDGQDSHNIANYIKAMRTAYVGNTWDKAGESTSDSDGHLIYAGWPCIALFKDNTLTRPRFGRTCLRISGASGSFTNPTHHVLVDGNTFTGWIHPAAVDGSNGTRYNYCLCTISPNTYGDQRIETVTWRNNTVSQCETALQLGACFDVLVDSNTFEFPNRPSGAPAFKFGSEFESILLDGIRFQNNNIVSDETRSNGGATGIIFAFTTSERISTGRYENIVLMDTDMTFTDGTPAAYWWQGTDPARWSNVYATGDITGNAVAKWGGGHNAAGVQQNPLTGLHTVQEDDPPA